MRLHDFFLVLASFLSEVVGTISGFGSSTFFVPLALMLESFQFVLAITAILHCFSNGSKIFLFRQGISKALFLRLALPSILLTGLGALLSSRFPSEVLIRVLGLVLILVAGRAFLPARPNFVLPPLVASGLCGLSGFITGLLGTGGAIRGAALMAMRLEKGTFIALSSSIDLGGDFLRAGIYLAQGYMDWSQWFYLPLLLLAGFFGALAGKKALQFIPQKLFERIVAFFILASGIAMLLGKDS